MNHLGTKRLYTERLILRPFVKDDAEPMFNNWANDSEVTKYLTWPPHNSVEITKRVLSDWISAYSDPRTYQWAIVPKELDEPIGSISAVKIDDDIGIVQWDIVLDASGGIVATHQRHWPSSLDSFLRKSEQTVLKRGMIRGIQTPVK